MDGTKVGRNLRRPLVHICNSNVGCSIGDANCVKLCCHARFLYRFSNQCDCLKRKGNENRRTQVARSRVLSSIGVAKAELAKRDTKVMIDVVCIVIVLVCLEDWKCKVKG